MFIAMCMELYLSIGWSLKDIDLEPKVEKVLQNDYIKVDFTDVDEIMELIES